MTVYTNFHTRALLTAEEMHADMLNRQLNGAFSLDSFLASLVVTDEDGNEIHQVDHPYYVVTETDDPGDGRTLAALCVMKENPISLEEGETWDGTPVMWFETEWVEA